MRHPAVPAFLALAAGSLAAFVVPMSAVPWAAAGAVAAWQVAMLAFVIGRPRLFAAAVFTSLACAAAAAAQHEDAARWNAPIRAFATPVTERPSGDALKLEGAVRDDAAPRGDGVALRLEVERVFVGGMPVAAHGGIALSVAGAFGPGAAAEWTRGRRVRLSATLRRPARYLNDGVADSERASARRGTALVGAVKSASLVEVIAPGTAWQEWCARARARVRRTMRAALAHDDEAAAVAIAILIGDRAGLSDQVERRLQRAGTYHVIAISGGNIALFATLAWIAARVLFRARRAAIVAAICMVLAYGAIVGAGASVGRAVLAAVFVLLGALLDQRAPPINTLASVGIAFLMWDPIALADVGFLLSFGATAGILIAMPMWLPIVEARIPVAETPRGERARRAGIVAAATVLASAAAELVLMPVQAHTFQRLTLAGLALNLVAIPAMAIVQVAGTTILLLDAVGAGHVRLVVAACRAGARALIDSAAIVDWFPAITWRVAMPPFWLVAIHVSALAAVAWVTAARRRRLVAAVACLTGLAIALSLPARAAKPHGLSLSMIDVGQAEALLLRLPSGRALLIDAGGSSFETGDRVVVPAVLARGVTTLDALVVTHPDADHIGGAPAALLDLAPARVLEGIGPARHPERDALITMALRAGGPIQALRAGGMFTFEDVTINVLHPPPPEWERQRVRNDDSLVLEVVMGEVALLLTGDAGEVVEREIVSRLAPARIRILKAGHHGSRTSTSYGLLAAARPAAALISAGRGNLYGHPHAAVVAGLHAAGVNVFRTDRDGQIDVTTDGRHVEIRTWSGRRWRLSARPR